MVFNSNLMFHEYRSRSVNPKIHRRNLLGAFSVPALGASVVDSVEEDDEYDAEARTKRAEREAAAAAKAVVASTGETSSSTKYGAIQKQSSTTSRSGR